MPPHRVVAVALDGLVVLDLAAPAHVFGHWGEDRYAFVLAGAAKASHVMTSTGFEVRVQAGLEVLADAGTVVVPGYTGVSRRPAERVLRELRRAHARGARIMSICTGAFALAHAGILDGRRATTHWDCAEVFAELFPRVRLDPAVLYVDEGSVLTSAGVAAGLDLCLHVVRRDHGAQIAAHIARHSVVAPHREGGQAQFVERPIDLPVLGAAQLEATRTWALEHLEQPLTISDMARHASVSQRTFARRFRAETGVTPYHWLLIRRVRSAQEWLETSDASIAEIAHACGFTNAATLRYHFMQVVGTSPTVYRRTFRRQPLES